jgi:hypothetical protein
VQIGRLVGRRQRPVSILLYPLHEKIRHPIGGVHIVRAASVIAGVLAQVEKLFNVDICRK